MAASTQQPGPDVPTVLAVPASILSNSVASQDDCKLLTLTNEVLLCVLKTPNLDVFDKACLALTCKQFGNLVYGFERELKPPGELKSGEEETLLELNDEVGYVDEEEQLEQRLVLIRRFKGRVNTEDLAGFLRRLDDGWSRNKADAVLLYLRYLPQHHKSILGSKNQEVRDQFIELGGQQVATYEGLLLWLRTSATGRQLDDVRPT